MFDETPITWEDFKARRPSDAENAARLADLVRRARAVRAHGWDDYRYVWSSGEVAGVAYLLGDEGVLRDADETADTVLNRYACDLFGVTDGQGDAAAGHPGTRAWFAHAQEEVAR
ncbi:MULTISPECIES: hypothetical protein [Nocardia]|uniref:hypothetical protein n=1 Tax=Nocardia TaxID=1817 RepID=UPI0024557AD8|nr:MULTISPECIES: hypothetical protein [Nocardia]